MKRSLIGIVVFCLAAHCVPGVAQAQYRPASAKSHAASSEEDSFSQSVNLKKFRKGNIEWDTQELIASGFTALHEEHQKILKELELVKKQLDQLKSEIHKLEAKP